VLEFLVVFLAFLLGGFIQTTAGFGSALVAMPVAGLVISIKTAAPTQALLGMIVSLTVLHKNRHALRWHEARRLIAGSVMGIPLGVLALRSFPSSIVTLLLSFILLGYGAFELWRRRHERHLTESPSLTADAGGNWAISWLVGFIAGTLGGAYATDGPPLIVFGALKRWPKEAFKSILQSCFLVNAVFIVACQAYGGLFTADVLRASFFALPGLLAGLYLGLKADSHIDHERFRSLLVWLILLLGVSLLASSIRGWS